jgi:hypothetical protein
MIFSGTANSKLLQFRLGREIADPFSKYVFIHPKTTWYNLASRMGMRSYYLKNAARVMDFFAELVAQRLGEGRRPLLIVKKCFLELCREGIQQRLNAMGLKRIRVESTNHDAAKLEDTKVVPIIHFGTIGTNLFEAFDCAYCLSGYYVNEPILDEIVQDVVASDRYVPLKIKGGGVPLRRTAGVCNAADRGYDVHELSAMALQQQETDVVLQAVGRVRPYTKPREIIMFQCAAHPQVTYTKEFNTLGAMRQFFQVSGARARAKTGTIEKVRAGKRLGLTQEQTAQKHSLSLRTVARYWNE